MVQLTRIYTKGGDKGKTSLGSGARVPKDHPRLQIIGSVDELNAAVGVVRTFIRNTPQDEMLAQIQNDLFDVGADLCVPFQEEAPPCLRLDESRVTSLEQALDALNERLTPLTSFVLPGGTQASAFVHLARTIARRAERDLCAFLKTEPAPSADVHAGVLKYLNRLSDYLFVLARALNDQGRADVLWQPGTLVGGAPS